MKKILLLLSVFGIMLISSCEGFLDVEPSNSANSSTSILNVNDAKVAMNGIMRSMASSDYYGRNFIMYGETKGGDLTIRSQGRGLDALYTFNHSATSNNYGGFWNIMYYCILQINNVIVNIEKIEAESGTSATLSNYKGQALTLRALVYYDLVRLYGKPYDMDKASYGVPIVLTPVDAKDQLTRASVAEVYAQIVEDLEASKALISKAKSNGFINYYGNRAIRARVALNMQDYASALSAAEEVINSGVYTLYTNSNWVDSWANAFSSESIFEIGVYENEANLGTASLGYYLLRLQKVTGASGWFMASDYYLDRLGEDPVDIRWSVMDYDESANTRFGSCLKYVGGPAMKGDKGGVMAATNVKVIRLSEVYLIAAEAALKQASPDKVKAKNYLNAIRKRAPSLDAADETNITMTMVENERSKELFAEGHRYFDMLRWNKTIEFNDDFIYPAVVLQHRDKIITREFNKTILPISKAEMDANPKIAAQQNPGY